jgi:hypothetical protein
LASRAWCCGLSRANFTSTKRAPLAVRSLPPGVAYALSLTREHACVRAAAAFLTQTVVLDDTTVKFEIWDTAGQEHIRPLALRRVAVGLGWAGGAERGKVGP